jgi:nitroreductase
MSAPTQVADAHAAASGFLDVLYRRRAVRSYTQDVIHESVISSLLDAAVHAPTAMHQEPWQFVIVQNREVLRRISDQAKAMAKREASRHGNLLRPPGAPGDGIASPLADPEFNIFYDAGTLVVICAEPSHGFVAADCWLAAENLMLAACDRGLGTCCIGFAVAALNSPETKHELGIPDGVEAFAPIILGVPHGEPNPVPRKRPLVLNWLR